MKYEVVELKEKVIVGVNNETGNADPSMMEIIGGVWDKLYSEGRPGNVKNRVNEYAIGLYSDYHEDRYQVTAGFEVSKAENSELVCKVIPAGKYAKFSMTGTMQDLVKVWDEIWEMDLDRANVADFEEYLNDDMEHAKIDVYVGIK